MNTAAHNPAAQQHYQHHQDSRSEAHAVLKNIRANVPDVINRRRKSSEMDDAQAPSSRVDRHLASRTQSVREPSSKHGQGESEHDRMLRLRQANEIKERRHSREVARMPSTVEPTAFKKLDFEQQQQAGGPVIVASAPIVAPTAIPSQQQQIVPSSASSSNTIEPPPSSGRQSRMSTAPSSKESYKRKYGELPGYSYIGTIGQGNFGKVLLAENDTTGEQVAVKILEKSQFKGEQQRLHATREAQLMATLRHPNIVDVKQVKEDEHRILIVMENLTGGELFDYISNKGSLDEKEARRIFQQIVYAIHYCHENNVVHRDLKPENILLDSEKNVRVADFGFGNHWHKDRHLTTYCGSPFYAAPEMVSGTPYIGPETDVWSLGVILYVLVCGRLPFDASDLPQLFAQIKRGNYQKPREGSIDVCSLIHRMLTVDPKRRASLTDVLKSRWMRMDGLDHSACSLQPLTTVSSPPQLPVRPAVTTTSPGPHPPTAATPPAAVAQATTEIAKAKPPAVQIPVPILVAPVSTHHHRRSYPAAVATADLNLSKYAPHSQPHEYVAPHHQKQQLQYHHNPAAADTLPQHRQQRYTHRDSNNMMIVDDNMSDVSASSSPTETLCTISPSTAGPSPREMLAAVPLTYRDEHDMIKLMDPSKKKEQSHHRHSHYHPREQYHQYPSSSAHQSSIHPDEVSIKMSSSSCTMNGSTADAAELANKKKRKTLNKIRQFFRFDRQDRVGVAPEPFQQQSMIRSNTTGTVTRKMEGMSL